jgi:15-cis-phytoene synthase
LSVDFDADRAIALNYVPQGRHAAVKALWSLDLALGQLVRTTTDPMVGQLRMTWWHERLSALDGGERLAEPVLAALAENVLPHDVSGAAMAGLIDGWDVLLDPPPIDAEALAHFARERGGRLFALTAKLVGGEVVAESGARWALVDLACHASPALAEQARAMALRVRASDRAPKALRVLTRIGAARLARTADRIALPLGRWEGLRAVLG